MRETNERIINKCDLRFKISERKCKWKSVQLSFNDREIFGACEISSTSTIRDGGKSQGIT